MYNGCGAMSEYRLKKWAFSPRQGQLSPQFKIEGVAPTNHCSCQKTGMLYTNVGKISFRFVTTYAFDKRTDRQTDGRTYKKALQYHRSM